ncbi:glycoside hydrolase family 51 protein [Glonium stellatum]|uniref:non-reducing end alpha-L-arabinofuranosidase n=1 Tax=Glonium stellatum TaxID=574774 RepID=A0A8E2JUY1_9PEZI|nr:glycoside hydrolase family 51 protein [Glonium stellatum]
MLKRFSVAIAVVTALAPSIAHAHRFRTSRENSLYSRITNSTGNSTAVELQISTKDTKGRNDTAPYLYGLMFEDISHSGDGGIYAEMITNRAFQGSNLYFGTTPGLSGNMIVGSENPIVPAGPVLTGWAPIGDVRMNLDILHPLSDALPTVMQLDVPAGATGEVGFLNYGWWGMDVSPQDYKASFYVLANAPRYTNNVTAFTVSLRSNLTGEVWASTKISNVPVDTVDYIQLNATISNKATAPDSNNTLAITMDASQVAGQTFYFDLISLFPETFKNRPNGLRKDIAEAFYDMKPKFLRFPGGNNIEGLSVQKRWKWWETIGPLKDRPGRIADWNYVNTDGLGLLEYLEWTEDMEMEPVLAVYSGFSLDVWGQAGTSFPESRMDEILQEALDELEYCMGSTSTKYGALRASHDHPAPFKINFIEIGNEDWFSSTYPYRFSYLYKGLKAAYPDITLISTAYNENADYNITIPAGGMWDTHHYEEPHYFLDNFNFYDNWQTSTNNEGVGVLLGEYSVKQLDSPSGVINWSLPGVPFPQLISAIAEGTYALGGERNPNTVKMSSYAPSLINTNWFNWTPDMISFNADPKQTVLSSSYWQQWLFAHFRGSQTLPVTNTRGDFRPLFWASSINDAETEVYLKVINSDAVGIPLTVNLDTSFKSVNGTIITNSNPNAYNTVEDMEAVVPRKLNVTSTSGKKFMWIVPAYSITVLQFDI